MISEFHRSATLLRMLIWVVVASDRVYWLMPASNVYNSMPTSWQASIAARQASAASCHFSSEYVWLNSSRPSGPAKPMYSVLPLNNGLAAVTSTFALRSEEHTSELPSLMRTSYAVFWLKKKKYKTDAA